MTILVNASLETLTAYGDTVYYSYLQRSDVVILLTIECCIASKIFITVANSNITSFVLMLNLIGELQLSNKNDQDRIISVF